MFELALGALIIALIAGALGFRGVSRAAATVAKVVFAIFLIVAVLLFVMILTGVSLFR